MYQDQFPPDDGELGYPPDEGFGEDPNAPPELEALPDATSPDWNVKGFSDERLRSLGAQLRRDIDAWYETVRPRLGFMEQWRLDHEVRPSGQPGPWEGSADVPSEGVRVACDNHATRLNQQIVNANPPFSCIAQEEAAIEAAPQIENAMTSSLGEAEWPVHADEVHNLLPRDGNCFFSTTYEVKKRRKPVLEVEHDEDATAALMQADVNAPDAMYGGLETNRQGAVVRSIGFRNETVYQGIRYRAIPFEDGVIIPATVREMEQARGIGEMLMISGEELRAGAKKGLYLKRAVDDLLRFDGDAANTGPADEVERERWDAQGLEHGQDDDVWDDPKKLYQQYKCFHICYRGDWNGDGEMEWARILLHYDQSLILKLQYLPWDHGEPEYDFFGLFPRPGYLIAQGVAELISPFQDAETTVICQLIDHADLQINLGSSLIIPRGMGLTVDNFELRLGKPLFVNGSPQEIMNVPLQPLPPEHYQLLALLKDKRDLLSRSNNTSVGKEAPGTQTLGELQILTAAGNLQFEDSAARVARTWAKVFDKTRWLLAQFGEGGEVRYRKTAAPAVQMGGDDMQAPSPVPAPPEFEKISAETLRAKVDIVPTGLAQLADLQSRMQQAAFTWQTLANEPAMQDPEVRLEVMDYLLTSYRVPVKDKILGLIRQFYQRQALMQQQMAAAAADAQAGQEAAQGNQMDAHAAGLEAQINAHMADMPPPGGGPPQGPAGPLTASMPPGNGSAPVGAI